VLAVPADQASQSAHVRRVFAGLDFGTQRSGVQISPPDRMQRAWSQALSPRLGVIAVAARPGFHRARPLERTSRK
jgi:hypothetical protein